MEVHAAHGDSPQQSDNEEDPTCIDSHISPANTSSSSDSFAVIISKFSPFATDFWIFHK